MAHGFVDVLVEEKSLLTSRGQKGKHMAAGERGYERFLRIDILRITQVGGRCAGRHFMAAIKVPGVIAIVSFVFEIGCRALPGKRHFVFGHAL
jgi:hypothetical protein